MTVKIVPKAAVDSSKKLSDILKRFVWTKITKRFVSATS